MNNTYYSQFVESDVDDFDQTIPTSLESTGMLVEYFHYWTCQHCKDPVIFTPVSKAEFESYNEIEDDLDVYISRNPQSDPSAQDCFHALIEEDYDPSLIKGIFKECVLECGCTRRNK